MYSTPRVALSLLLLFCTFGPALTQNEMQQVTNSSTDIVTVAANAQGVRFTSPNGVVQLRLEIYSSWAKSSSTRSSVAAMCLTGTCRTAVASALLTVLISAW